MPENEEEKEEVKLEDKKPEEVKSDKDFRDLYQTDIFQRRIKLATEDFNILEMNLSEHISQVTSDYESDYKVYTDARDTLLKSKKEWDEHMKELEKYDHTGVYAEQRAIIGKMYGSAILGMVHLHASQAILVQLCNSAIKFSYKTMGKDFKTNLREAVREKFESALPQISELIFIAQQAGLKPMEKIQERTKLYSKRTGVSEDADDIPEDEDENLPEGVEED